MHGEKIRLLVVDGVSNHDWRHRLELLQAILCADGSFEITTSLSPETADSPGWDQWCPAFSEFDVVLSAYNDINGRPGWPAKVRDAFEAYVRNGGSFYCYHEANNAFADWPAYNEMIGLGWRPKDFGSSLVIEADETITRVPPGSGGDTGHGNRVDVEVRRIGDHPIHAGLPRSWKAADIEIYFYARGPAQNLTVLAYAKEPQTGLQFPIEWIVNYGAGKVFVSTYGHVWRDQRHPNAMRCAAFQTIMLRALKWLAGRDPGPVPADFPSPEEISLRF